MSVCGSAVVDAKDGINFSWNGRVIERGVFFSCKFALGESRVRGRGSSLLRILFFFSRSSLVPLHGFNRSFGEGRKWREVLISKRHVT